MGYLSIHAKELVEEAILSKEDLTKAILFLISRLTNFVWGTHCIYSIWTYNELFPKKQVSICTNRGILYNIQRENLTTYLELP